jgi:hypothetical protein
LRELSKIVVLVSCLYLLVLAVRLPQIDTYVGGQHRVLATVAVSGLAVVSLFAIGVFLQLIFP